MNFASSSFACHDPCDIQIMSLSLPKQRHTKHDSRNLLYSDSFDIFMEAETCLHNLTSKGFVH